MTATKQKRQAKPQSKPQHTLDAFAAAAGDRLEDLQSIESLLGTEAALSAESHADEVWDDRLGRRGYPMRQVCGMLRQNKTPIELTDLGCAMVECNLQDFVCINPAEEVHSARCQELFCVPKSITEAALGGHKFSVSAFADWVERERIPHHLSVTALSQILRHRRVTEAAEAAEKAEKERPREFHELVTECLEADAAAEEQERHRQRRQRLKVYREILDRRHKPGEQDAAKLAFVSRELGFDGEQVCQDCRLLDQIDRLTSLAGKVDAATADRDRLEAEFNEAKKAVDALKNKEREFGRAKDHCRTCGRAETEARRLRDANPDLFSGD